MPQTDFHWITDHIDVGSHISQPEESPFEAHTRHGTLSG